jgi:predicted TIM-barrel fold metal-dependent hydrolase
MIAPRKALEGLADLALSVDVEAAFLAGNASRVYRLPAATTVNQADHQQTETQ